MPSSQGSQWWLWKAPSYLTACPILRTEMARDVEGIIRRHGATPATIAVMQGVPCVGLSPDQLQLLASRCTSHSATGLHVHLLAGLFAASPPMHVLFQADGQSHCLCVDIEGLPAAALSSSRLLCTLSITYSSLVQACLHPYCAC